MRVKSMQKKAVGVGDPSASDFETTFGDLAHAQLRDSAPQLLDYLLGFQVIESNEDQTHGVGVLGFSLGKQMLFVPSFFLNGELKQNLIYIKNQDLFVPLQDNWVSYLLNRRPFTMGKPEARNETELGVMQPDFSTMSNTQSGGSAATIFGTRQANWDPWTAGIDKMFSSLTGRYDKLTDLPSFLKKTAGYGTANSLLRAMRSDSSFGNGVLRFYKLASLMHKPVRIRSVAKRRPGFIYATHRSPLLHDLVKEAIASDPGLVRVLHGPEALKTILPMDDVERVLRGEIVVKDARENANQAYRADEGVKLVSPDFSGRYELLLSNGKFTAVYICVAPRTIGQGYSRVCLVVDQETKNFSYFWCDTIWVKPNLYSKNEAEDYIDGLSSVGSTSPNKIYTILAPTSNTGTVAFRVKRKTTESNGCTELYVQPIFRDPGIQDSHSDSDINDEDASQFGKGQFLAGIGDVESRTNISDEEPSGEDSQGVLPFNNLNHIVICDDHRIIRVVRNTLFVPSSAKIIELKEGNKLETWAAADPASLIDLEANLLKDGAQHFEILRKGASYYVDNHGPFERIDVVRALVKKAGLRGDPAIAIVDGLKDDKRTRFLVKVNAMFSPPFPEPQLGYNDYAGIMEQYPTDELQEVTTNIDTNPEAYLNRPGSNLAENQRNQIMDAAQTGQKDIFDTSAIASLVRTSNSDDLITQYLSDIILGLDRVNRIMFMYYWLNEQFRDRYGQENMIDLEDQLKDVSKGLGDLVLFLKQRQVESSPNFDAMEIELGGK